MKVLLNDDQRSALGTGRGEGTYRFEGLLSLLLWREVFQGAALMRGEQVRQERHDPFNAGLELAGALAELLFDLQRVVPFLDGEVGAEDLQHGQVRRGFPIGHAVAFQPSDALALQRPPKLVKESGFSDACLTYNRDRLPVSALYAYKTITK